MGPSNGQGVVVPGCPTCRKKFGTMPQFLDHLTDDVLPAALDGPSAPRFQSAITCSLNNQRSNQPKGSILYVLL
jgi:hypothetical protein